jgi:hypothetical protein
MAEAGAPIKEMPKPRPSEVLAMGGEYKGKLKSSSEAAKAQKKVKDLRKLQEEGKTGKELFEGMKTAGAEPAPTSAEADLLAEKFGVGKATRGKDGKLKPPSNDPEALNIHETARKEINQVNDFLTYSEISTEAQNTGKPIQELLNERQKLNPSGPKTEAEFKALRDKSIDHLISVGVGEGAFGDLSDLSVAERRDYIEKMIAKDPELRTAIAGEMKSISEKADQLPEQPKNQDYEEAKSIQKESMGERDEALAKTIEMLNDRGIADTAEFQKQLDTLIKEGKSPEAALSLLQASFVNETTIPHLEDFQKYQKDMMTAERLQARLDSYDIRKQSQTVIDETHQKLKEVQDRIDAQEQQITSDNNLNNEFQTYTMLVQLSSPMKDPNSGVYISPLAERLHDAIKAQRKIADADKKIKDLEPEASKGEREWRVQRLAQERQLVSELQSVMKRSVGEVMGERYDEVVRLQEADLTKKESETNDLIDKSMYRVMRTRLEEAKKPGLIMSNKGETQPNKENIKWDYEDLVSLDPSRGPKMIMRRYIDEALKTSITDPTERSKIIEEKMKDQNFVDRMTPIMAETVIAARIKTGKIRPNEARTIIDKFGEDMISKAKLRNATLDKQIKDLTGEGIIDKTLFKKLSDSKLLRLLLILMGVGVAVAGLGVVGPAVAAGLESGASFVGNQANNARESYT